MAWYLCPSEVSGGQGWIIEEFNKADMSEVDFLLLFANWKSSTTTANLPDPSRIVGMLHKSMLMLCI
jgi:hypothetical protein